MSPLDLGLVLLSAFLHALWNTQAKGSANPVGFMLVLQWLCCVVTTPLLLLCNLGQVPAEVWILLLGTGLAHAFYAYWLAMSYTRGELSVVYPISRSTPAFVPLVAVPLLGDAISAGGAVGIALVVLGIWLVQSGGRLRLRDLAAPGAGYAYLTLGATVAYSLCDKRAMQLLAAGAWSGPLPRAVFYYVMLVLIPTPLLSLLARSHRRDAAALARRELRTVAGAALAGFASYVLILEALRRASVSYVVAARQLSVVFALGFAAAWLRERPTPARLAGALATVVGVAAIALAG